jgi:tetratricopeptide (TPR) repeat protein
VTADKDFFISYTAADQAWAEWIADTLERAGRRTVLQAWDFRPGENFLRRMDEALAAAERVLAVLSPAYLRSEYAREEWTAALVRGRGQTDRLLPVRVEACELPPLLANRIYLDLAGLDEPTATQRLLAAVDPGRARPARKLPFPGSGRAQFPTAQFPTAQFPGQRPRILHVPPRNPNFTGRKKLLTRLHRDLNGRKTVTVVQAGALHGLGGVGKTQLALEYAHRHAADYDLIWWVTADQPPTIPSQLVALAHRLGIPGPIGQAETVAALLDELRHHGRWLLVFDNVEDPHDLRPYWPSTGGGHVLVTSRNPAWTGVATTFPLEVLSRSDAVAFLQRRAGLDRQAADALGDLPLALEQAAAYLDQTGTPPQEYLGLLRERGPELFALGRPVTSEKTIATTWTVSLDRIRTEFPIARDLLRMCAFLGSGDLPRVLLTEHPEVLPEQLAVALRDQVAFQQALGAIRRYSLATVTTEMINVHRLVQAVVRHQLDHDQAQEWAAAALRLVRAALPSDHTDRKAWPRYARLLPHVLAVTQQAQVLGIEPELAASLLNQAAVYLRARAVYQQARGLNERALALREAHLGPDHPDTATSLSNLALVLRDQGDLDGARALHERALAVYETHLGPDHPDTARALNNLAMVLHLQGDLDGARTLNERALAIREAELGPDHPDTARSLNHLAQVLRDQGDLRHAQGDVVGARSLYERVLAIRTAYLGPDHAETVQSQWDLALVTAELLSGR